MKALAQLAVLLVLIAFPACKKCKDCNPQQPGVNPDFKQTWKVTKVTQVGMAEPVYQSPLPAGKSILEDYSRYRLTFVNDTDYTLVERNANTTSGKWALAADGSKIVLNPGSANEQVLNVIKIEKAYLELQFTVNSTKTGNRDLTISFIPT